MSYVLPLVYTGFLDLSRRARFGSTTELTAHFQGHETIDASDCAVLPGLIDAHMHTPLAIARGVAQDVTHWMQRALAPYSRHMTPAATLAGTQLNVLEALKAGTTTLVDYARPVPGWAEVFVRVGVRARLTPTIMLSRRAEWPAGRWATSTLSIWPPAKQP
jgi:5-methylthioadenosine/S-adenosylhomocysteine deaminase